MLPFAGFHRFPPPATQKPPNTTLQPPNCAAGSIQVRNTFPRSLRLNVKPLCAPHPRWRIDDRSTEDVGDSEGTGGDQSS